MDPNGHLWALHPGCAVTPQGQAKISQGQGVLRDVELEVVIKGIEIIPSAPRCGHKLAGSHAVI